MREWTTEERYRVLKDASEIRDLYDQIKDSDYRQHYHIQPITGLSSDPNGFVYHKGTWHLCYQWCPWGAVHGLKYWYHVTSTDLVHWQNQGVGMHPDSFYDNKGVHSGSGFSTGEDLYYFYTGNHRDENWVRTPYSCVAKVNDDNTIEKFPEPLFGPRDGYTEHQRDPKVVYDEDTESYYIFIGAQNDDLQGRALIYKSKDLLSGWEFAGELNVVGFENFGGMWECPSIQRISGKDVLVFSPQYTKLPNRGESTNHNIYLIGKMDYANLTFTPEGDYRHLDYGFDFYAAQFAASTGETERAILTAWIGLPDNHYPTEEEDWEGSLVLPRELRIENGQLKQLPLAAVKDLREAEVDLSKGLPRVAEVELEFGQGDASVALFQKEVGTSGLQLNYDAATNTLTVDRSKMDLRFNEQIGEVLSVPFANGLQKASIYIDKNSVEIFFNDGEATFTTHLFPTKEENQLVVSENVTAKAWTLAKAVTDDFVV